MLNLPGLFRLRCPDGPRGARCAADHMPSPLPPRDCCCAPSLTAGPLRSCEVRLPRRYAAMVWELFRPVLQAEGLARTVLHGCLRCVLSFRKLGVTLLLLHFDNPFSLPFVLF